ncbi:MAG: hypothetical protein KDN22_09140 [Verrucomicrobiae bacterium]|nr:hypothetical protein [Verrucomicrobiae bacterium]
MISSAATAFRVLLATAVVGGFLSHCAPPEPVEKIENVSPAARLAECTHTAQLSALTEETVRSHMLTSCYWLQETSNTLSIPIEEALAAARASNGETDSVMAQETGETLARNLEILKSLGCLEQAGMQRLRKGEAPAVPTGPNAGTNVSIIHIIPPSRVQDLANQAFNLTITDSPATGETSLETQLEFARRWNWQGLLDDHGFATIVYAFPGAPGKSRPTDKSAY